MYLTRMGVYQISSVIRFFVLVALCFVTNARHGHYAGWKSYYVKAKTEEQVKALHAVRIKLGLDFLSLPHVNRRAVVLVTPEQQKEFVKNLNHLGIKYRVHVDNVKSALDHDHKRNEELTKSIARDGGEFLSYNNYERWDNINAYMEHIASKYSNFTNLVTFATTYEGRPIRFLRISTTKFKDKSKPIIMIEGGMHAREWLSPPTVTWAIRKLTENVTERDLVNYFDWILMPVANPDGYVHTFSGRRFWRKNRSRVYPNDPFCPGVDTNRNFDIAWNSVGTEGHTCSHLYPGSKPFTEMETQAIRDILQRQSSRIALFLSMHSYGNLIVYPWGYNNTPSYFEDALNSVGVAMGDAIFHLGRPIYSRLIVGNHADLLYKCSGTSVDYAHSLGIQLVFSFELPGFAVTRSHTGNNTNGFHLDPEYIDDVCRATWAAIVVGARRAKMRFDLT